MNIQWKDFVLSVTGLAFDARLTLIESGQTFLWREHEGRFFAVIHGDAVCLEPREDGMLLYPVDEADVDGYIHYFDLTRDYGALSSTYAHHRYAAQALKLLPGLRVLNQPTWDALVTFILSANNNMARIRQLAWLLCDHFGEACTFGGGNGGCETQSYGWTRAFDGLTLRALPAPDVLARVPEQTLRDLRFGYRAPFLIGTARKVAAGFPLAGLAAMPYDEAHRQLVTLPGVGDKVADCVLLFGCGHASAFPVDVWVARLISAWFPELVAHKTRPALARAARALLGPDAGVVQQFMFHCARCGLIKLEGPA